MYSPTVAHAVAITVVPGPGIAPQTSYHLRDMIGRALRESPLPVKSADAHVAISRESANSPYCSVTADIDIDCAPIHAQAHGVTAREAVDVLETRLRARLADPRPQLCLS
jgi:hypothetical protein